MITELLMQQGSFTVPLTIDTPHSIWERIGGTESTGADVTEIGTPGHVVITPQEMEPIKVGGVSVLAEARYTGVIKQKKQTNRKMSLTGVGLEWWLGTDDGLGDIIRPEVVLSASTMSNALDNLLPAAITKGVVTETGLSTITSNHHFSNPLEAIRTVMAQAHCEFRINPDGVMDAGGHRFLFNVAVPTVVASRDASGSDPNFLGIPIAKSEARRDYSQMATGGLVYITEADGTRTEVAGYIRGTTQRDLHGNAIVHEFAEEQVKGDSAANEDYIAHRLSQYVTNSFFSLDTDFYEVEGGMPVGDAWHVFDPPAFVDLSNPIQYRGDVIYPLDLRVMEATWPVRDGMGVYFRPSIGTGGAGAVLDSDWIDLTQFVAWEERALTRIILEDLTDFEVAGG